MLIDLYDVIHRRRDVRAEFTGAPVPDEVLHRVLTAAHAAPSVGLTQPWDFVLVRDPAVRDAFHAHVQQERQTFAQTLDPVAAARFAHIKIDGVREATLSIVVTCGRSRGRLGLLLPGAVPAGPARHPGRHPTGGLALRRAGQPARRRTRPGAARLAAAPAGDRRPAPRPVVSFAEPADHRRLPKRQGSLPLPWRRRIVGAGGGQDG